MAQSIGDTMTTGLRIAYDAQLSIGQYRGMGRYLRALIAGREQSVLGFCSSGARDPELRLIADGTAFYPLWEQFSIPRLARRHAIDVFIAPYNTAPLALPATTRLVLIVHDLIYMEHLPPSQSLYQNAGRIYRRLVTPHAIARANLVITVSRYTATSLASRFGVDPGRLRIIPNSVAGEWFVSGLPPAQSGRYVLTVAGEAPSKNLKRALEAFALCRRRALNPGLRMKVAGVKPAFHAAFAAHAHAVGAGDWVDFLPYLADDAMRSLYRGATALLMPSLAEGFGIPMLEAMAIGVPVAASNAASLPEVGGEAALFFDPTSTEHMAEILHQIVFDSGLQARMAELGRIQARKFHPDVIRAAIQRFWDELGQAGEPSPARELASC